MYQSVFLLIVLLSLILNFFLLIFMIFLEKRKPQNIIAWMTVLVFLPIVGFVIYIVFGSGLSIRVRRMIKKKAISERDMIRNINGIETLEEARVDSTFKNDREFATLCYNFGAYPLPGNDIQIFTSGLSTIEALKNDIKNAKKSIHIEYYIFENDSIGKEIMNLLCEKAREGVDVKLIYDSVGSIRSPKRFFKGLEKAGGKVGEFFPPFLHIRLINLKINYRNHRKIVVIDGKIGYTGGVNLRDDHMGKNKKLSPWRDTHIRIKGSGVYSLQNIFIDDWRYCTHDNTPPKIYLENGYFPSPEICGKALIQTISSGPDSSIQKIKEAFVKMIMGAKERVYIQTPYFIPDDVFFSALRIAVKSGVDVRIMVPSKPDKKMVYFATLSYLKEMAEMGIKVYLYNGFLHSKTVLVDSNKLSVGTCNMDNRSFGLNFEDTVIIYSEEANASYSQAFEEDVKNSSVAGINYFKKKRWITKLLQAIMRLFSSLL